MGRCRADGRPAVRQRRLEQVGHRDVYAVRDGAPGKDPWAVLAINAFGFAVIIATAYSVRWFKSHPWRKPPEPKSETGRAAAPLNRQERAA